MKKLEDLCAALIGLASRHRRAVATAVYSVITGLALGSAFMVRFEFQLGVLGTPAFAAALVLLVPIRLGVNYRFRLGLGRWRYVSVRDCPGGLRPGEKLHEELAAPDERAVATSAKRVSLLETPAEFGELPLRALAALTAGEVGDLLAYLFGEFPHLDR